MAALKTLLENLDVTVVRGTTELDVPDVVYDSRKNCSPSHSLGIAWYVL